MSSIVSDCLIYVTGVLELLLALALLIPGWARQVGIILAAMLILFLPANIYAAMHHVPYGGNEIGPVYLLARVPYQVFLVTWTLWATGLLWRTDATYRTDADAA